MDPIKKEYFCKKDSEKTKLNWFCYEFAFGLYDKIKTGKAFEQFRKANTEQQLVDFSVYFSKKMKHSIYQRLSGMSSAVLFYEEYVEEFYPKINQRQAHQILKAAMKAWDELTGWCVTCPNRCISEMNVYCHMFDMLDENDSFK
jgi:hypothetical protein